MIPSTKDLIKVLESNRTLLTVELEKSKEVSQETWKQFRNDVYGRLTWDSVPATDGEMKSLMDEFSESDSLELVNKQGKLLKRLEKAFKLKYGKKLTTEFMGWLGDRLQYFTSKDSATYYIDFTDVIDWSDGQFGKEDSCWWGGYRRSRKIFTDGGGWGIRFYDDENQNNDNGIGRAWILPKDDMLMVFNCYGVARPDVSKIIKSVYAQHGITLHYKKVNLHNSHSSELPYINHDHDGNMKSSSFILYPEGMDESSLLEKYDIDLKVSIFTCRDCANDIDEDDDVVNIHGRYYCQSCADYNFSFCDNCEEYHSNDDVHSVREEEEQEPYIICESCANNNGWTLCDSCSNYSQKCEHTDDTGMDYCPDCIEACSYCDECEHYYSDIREHNNDEHNQERIAQEKSILKGLHKSTESVNVGWDNKILTIYHLPNHPELFIYKNDNKKWSLIHKANGGACCRDSKELVKIYQFLQMVIDKFPWHLPADALTLTPKFHENLEKIINQIFR